MSDVLKEEEAFFEDFENEEFSDEHEVRYKELDPDIFESQKEVVVSDRYNDNPLRWKDPTNFHRPEDIKGYVANTVIEANKAFNEDTNPYKVPELYIKSRGRGSYTPAQKVAAAQGWLVSGSMADAAMVAGLDVITVRKWKYSAPWWNEVVRRLKVHQQDSIEAMLNTVVNKSLSHIMDRLENGDEFITKDGDKDYLKVKAKDLASIVGQMQTAKKNMTENQEINTKEINTLSMLEDKLRSIAKAELGKTIISDQSIEDN